MVLNDLTADLVRSQHTDRLHFADPRSPYSLTFCGRRILDGERVSIPDETDFHDRWACGTCVGHLLLNDGGES